jgi:hypothetical protein
MVVGVALVEIQVHGSRSLKEKRGVVRSLSSRVERAIVFVEEQHLGEVTGSEVELVPVQLEE